MKLPDSFIPDNGLHKFLPKEIVNTGDDALYMPKCCCGWSSSAIQNRGGAFLEFVIHAESMIFSELQPKRIPLGARVGITFLVMLCLCMLSYGVGQYIITSTSLGSASRDLISASSVLIGFGAAFSFMIATRHFVMPMKKSRNKP